MAYRFGRCSFDPARRQLTRDGEEVALSPRAFAALSVLLTRYPEAVSKRDLYEELWPNTFVELTNLNNVIAEIRTAIGDRNKSIVKTKHRFGYVFAASLSAAQENIDAPFVLLIGSSTYPLREENLVGRTSDAAVMIAAPSISRKHAVIRIRGKRVEIEDLRSKNGTSIDGKAVTDRQEVPDGATVCFGTVCGIFRALPRGKSTLTDKRRVNA